MKPKYPKYAKEVQELLAHLDNENGEQDTGPFALSPPENEIDMYVEEDRITFIPRRLHGIPVNEQDIVDSTVEDLDTTPFPTQPAPQPTSNVARGVWLFGLLVPLFCIAAQFYLIMNPLTVNITLAARSRQVSLQGTLQLGRALNPITLSQSQTVPTTGKGHQDAHSATGYITFYNGLFSEQTVAAGTTLTGSDGVQVVTDQEANIPSGNPPTYGQITVLAHAINPGSGGNIAAYDINETCCASGILAKNLQSFTSGQDERNFQAVAKSDIDNVTAPLQADLAASLQGALQGQLKQDEQLQPLPCSPTTTSDHRIGEEATQIKVTVSETCSGIAYNDQELTNKVTQLLNTQAVKKLGAGYSMLENPQVTITSAIPSKPVVLSFTTVSTWIYALSSAEQKHIKKIIAGKNAQEATRLLNSLPGIERVTMQSSGFGDDSRIPKDIAHIHLLIFYAAT
jgi:hypothetical protein